MRHQRGIDLRPREPGYQFVKGDVDFKAPRKVHLKARKVDFKAPERGPFEGPGRCMPRQALKKATVALLT